MMSQILYSPFSLTENELSWDSSDWEATWDGGENKEEGASPATTVCPQN